MGGDKLSRMVRINGDGVGTGCLGASYPHSLTSPSRSIWNPAVESFITRHSNCALPEGLLSLMLPKQQDKKNNQDQQRVAARSVLSIASLEGFIRPPPPANFVCDPPPALLPSCPLFGLGLGRRRPLAGRGLTPSLGRRYWLFSHRRSGSQRLLVAARVSGVASSL